MNEQLNTEQVEFRVKLQELYTKIVETQMETKGIYYTPAVDRIVRDLIADIHRQSVTNDPRVKNLAQQISTLAERLTYSLEQIEKAVNKGKK